MKNRPNAFLPLSSLVSATTIALAASASATVWQWDGGAGSGNWQTAANWNPDALNLDFNGTFAHRLNVNGAQAMSYTAAEGNTTYTGDPGNTRGLVVGSGTSGTMIITGGTFSTLGAVSGDIIGNSNSSTGILTINGGNYIGTNAGTNLGLGTGTGRVSTLNISSGKATLATLNLNSSDADVNLSGTGELEVNTITMTVGSVGNISFNGGTLRARTATTTFLQGLTGATINGGGVTVDSNGVNITIGQALLAGTGTGGLTKIGTGTLTLTGTNTYIGATTLSAGTLSVGTTANLGAAASNLVFDGGTLQITGTALTNFSGIGHSVSFNSGKGVGIDINSVSNTFTADQVLNQGAGGLTKSGAGTLILNQANSYTGVTTISDGILNIRHNNALGSTAGNTTIASGKKLQVEGAGLSIAENFSVAGGIIENVSGNNTLTGSITKNSNALFLLSTAGKLTVQGDILGTNNSVNLQGAGDGEVSGSIATAFALNKTGAGTWTLSGASYAYAGNTNVNEGTLRAGSTQAFSPNSLVNLANTAGVTLDLNGNSVSINALTGGGTTGGTVALGASNLTIKAVTNNQTYSGFFTGSGKIIVDATTSTNVVNFGGTNTASSTSFTGNVEVTSGILSLGKTANILGTNSNGAGTQSVTVSSGATARLAYGNAAYDQRQNFIISGTGADSNGALQATGMAFGNAAIGGLAVAADATIRVNRDSSNNSANYLNVVGALAGAGDLTISGAGTTKAGFIRFSAASAAIGSHGVFSGDINLRDGITLTSANATALGNIGTLDVADGTSFVLAASQSIGALADSTTTLNTGSVSLAGNTLTIGNPTTNLDSSFTGIISGAGGGITKAGAGTLTLTNANTYTGATTVSGGVLAINGSLANTTTTIGNTGTLRGSGSIAGSVTVQNGGTIAAGNSIESLATGTLTLNEGSTFAYEIDNGALAGVAGDLTAVTGALNLDSGNGAVLTIAELGSGSWNLGAKLTLISYSGSWNGGLFDYLGGTLADDSTFTFSGVEWRFNYNDTSAGTNYTGDLVGSSFVTMTAIPEPGALALAALGSLALLSRRRSTPC